jgi:hypothetical protein
MLSNLKELKVETMNKKEENIEMPELEKPVVPEYTLVDVMRELKTTQNKIDEFLVQVKALGGEVVKSNEEVIARLEIHNTELYDIKDAIVHGLAVIGRNQTNTQSQSPQQPKQVTEQQTNNLTKTELDALPWKDNKFGQWMFATTQDGEITAGAEKLTTTLLANGGKLKDLYGRDYRLKDKFINRTKEKKQ